MIKIFDNFDAITSLVGGAITVKIDGTIVYHDNQIPPTKAEIDAEIIRLQAEWDSQEYARNRAEQYPDLAEQLDLLWHAIDTDTLDDKDYRNKFYTRLKKVKEDNPKG